MLYIPHSSDKTRVKVGSVVVEVCFTSHIVQIKRRNASDGTGTTEESFTSHIVQIKQFNCDLISISFAVFTSHILQIKHGRVFRTEDSIRIPLHPTYFR